MAKARLEVETPDGVRLAIKRHPDGTRYVQPYLGTNPVTGRKRRPYRRLAGATSDEEAAAMALAWWEDERANPRVADALDAYVGALERMGSPANTVRTYRTCVRWVRPIVADSRVRDVTPALAGDLYAALLDHGGVRGGRLAPVSVRKTQLFLDGSWAWISAEYGIPGPCPFTAALRPTVVPGEARAMGEDDLAAFGGWLVGAMAGEGGSGELRRCQAMAMHLALTCGLRVGEACALRRADAACARRDLYVGGTVVEGARAPYRQDTLKTRSSRRHVALSEETAEALARHKARCEPSGRDAPLLSPDGSWMRPSAVSRRFSEVRDELGLDRRLTFHSLRHTHATWLPAEGVDIRTVQERLGHADVATTLRIYGHVLPGRDAAAAAAFGRAMRRAAGA